MTAAKPLAIAIDAGSSVSGLLLAPEDPRACYVFAHGAGAGMAHPFMVGIADGLAERGIATLRYQFPYMEQGSKRPDAFRDAVDMACENAELFREESVKFGKVRPGDVPMIVTQLNVQYVLVGKHLGQNSDRSIQPRVCDP